MTTTPLKANGKNITNDSGIIRLKGVNYTYFMDTPSGSWMDNDGTIYWDGTPTTEQNWRTDVIGRFLDGMASWKVNCIRVIGTAEYWIKNTLNYQSHIAYFINECAKRGIYVIFTFWRLTEAGQTGYNIRVPYPPNWNTTAPSDIALITSSQDFVNLWADVASKLKGYNNVIFEFWNEPNGDATIKDSWFVVVQQCINAVRNVDASNLIDVTWTGITYDFTTGYTEGFDWINQYPLTDANLAYDMHAYRTNAYRINNVYDNYAHTLAEITQWLTVTKTIAQTKPIIIGEIGYDNFRANQAEEAEFFENTLAVLDQNGISYCAWAGPPWALYSYSPQWGLVYSGANYPNYAPTPSGTIFKSHLSPAPFNWLPILVLIGVGTLFYARTH